MQGPRRIWRTSGGTDAERVSRDNPHFTLVEVRQLRTLLRAGLLAGATAAATLGIAEIAFTVWLGGTLDDPFRRVSSVVLGPEAFASNFSLALVVAAGAAVHIGLSLLFGLVFLWLVAFTYQLSARAPLLLLYGVLFGLALWELNILTVLRLVRPAVAPQFGIANQVWNGIIAYAIFYGLVLGAYVALARPGVVADWKR
ncbi:MAG: hypothetical protein ACR2IK_25075 [Chloroflexota bacterium]